MKKTLLFLLTLTLSFIGMTTANAQSLEFEITRTPEIPGFFMVRFFPGSEVAPIMLQDIFVKNYKDRDAEIYDELTPFLQEFGGKIIEKSHRIN